MRRHKTHVVTRGHLRGEGKTKTEAKADLERQIDYALSPYGTWIETRHGCVLIVASTLTGFETKVILPDMLLDHGKRHFAGCHITGSDIRSIVMGLRLHVAQYVWTVDYNDAQLIAESGLDDTSQLESWIRFQRSFAAHKLAGASDADAHRLACTH